MPQSHLQVFFFRYSCHVFSRNACLVFSVIPALFFFVIPAMFFLYACLVSFSLCLSCFFPLFLPCFFRYACLVIIIPCPSRSNVTFNLDAGGELDIGQPAVEAPAFLARGIV
jgi:hypothetical protein